MIDTHAHTYIHANAHTRAHTHARIHGDRQTIQQANKYTRALKYVVSILTIEPTDPNLCYE